MLSKWWKAAATVAVFLPVLLLSGCAGISLIERTAPSAQRGPGVVVAPSSEQHDVAVTSISFDPALGTGKSARGRASALLAVIENRGKLTETDLDVTATLVGVSGEDEVLARRSATVPRLVPGESTVVAFEDVQALPLRNKYLLTVEVQSQSGETNLKNNQRTFEIQVVLRPE